MRTSGVMGVFMDLRIEQEEQPHDRCQDPSATEVRQQVMRRQLEVCAARLPEQARTEFLALHKQAAELMKQAGALLRAAWALYRQHVPKPLGAKPRN